MTSADDCHYSLPVSPVVGRLLTLVLPATDEPSLVVGHLLASTLVPCSGRSLCAHHYIENAKRHYSSFIVVVIGEVPVLFIYWLSKTMTLLTPKFGRW